MIQNLTASQVNQLPPDYQKIYQNLKNETENFDADFLADEDINKVVTDFYYKAISKLKEAQPKASSQPKKKVTPKKAPQSAKTVKMAKPKVAKTAKPKKVSSEDADTNASTRSKDVIGRSESTLASKYIYRFWQMLGKKTPRSTVEKLLIDINKAAANLKLRKNSYYSEAITWIGKFLSDKLNTGYSSFTFTLEKSGEEKIKKFARGHETPDIRALRRYYGAQNQKFETKHIGILSSLKKLKNPIYQEEVKMAIKNLENAKKSKGIIKATAAQLRGLQGINKGSSQKKKVGRELHGVNPYVQGAIVGAVSGVASVGISKTVGNALSGIEIMGIDYPTLDLPMKWKEAGLSQMPYNASVLLFGKPKFGKSTLALELANDLSMIKPVLYVSSEEMLNEETPSKSLQDRMERVGYTDNMYFSKNLEVDIEPYQFIFIDSINALGIDNQAWRELREQYPQKFFVLVSQVTKNGVFRGSQEWAHDVDVIVDVEKHGQASVMGRFGTGNYQIF